MPDRFEARPAVIRATRDLTADIRLFEIAPADGFVPPTPGSHIDVAVEIDGARQLRSYSIIGPCADRVYRIAVKRLATGRGGGAYLWGLAPGAALVISDPRNGFVLRRGASEYVLVAGGIGITPIFTMALSLAETTARFRVLYACRQREHFALAEELRRVIGDRLAMFVTEEGRRIDFTAEITRLHPAGELYVCGPLRMLEAARRAWIASGRPIERLRYETFGSSGHLAPQPFRVMLPRLGQEIEVPAERSILEALESAGIEMISDCRRGECGVCVLPILDAAGIVDHRDVFFSEDEKAENRRLCTCVSRAVGVLTLDTADRPE